MKPINLNHPKYIELMDFLIEKTEDMKWQLNIRELAEEYKQRKGSSKGAAHFRPSKVLAPNFVEDSQPVYEMNSLVSSLAFLTTLLNLIQHRIDYLLGKVGKSERIDRAAKVRMMFAFGTYASWELMNELQENAFVELDEYSRITKYRAHDGSLTLEGIHPLSVTSRVKNRRPHKSMLRESTKRAAVEVPDNSSKRLKIEHVEPEANHESAGDYGSFEHLNQIPENYVPLENTPFSGSIKIANYPRVQLLQEPPREPSNLKIKKLREPKREIEFFEAPGAPKNAYTSQKKFLKTIRSLIITLDMPTLSTLQANIEKKLEESPDAKIPNDVMILAMELMIAKIAHQSMSILSETVESVSLSNFLCYLQALLLNSKLEGLEGLMEKIKERNKEPDSKDKSIPVEKVARALQDIMYNVGF